MVCGGRGSVGQSGRIAYPRRGEIYLAHLDPTVGAEISKTRRVLVVQNDVANRYSPIAIVATITSRFGDRLCPTEVLIEAPEGGLTSDSVVLLNQIRSIDKQRLIKHLGVLKPATVRRVDGALTISLGLVSV
jgi:mRNA interferase MazF